MDAPIPRRGIEAVVYLARLSSIQFFSSGEYKPQRRQANADPARVGMQGTIMASQNLRHGVPGPDGSSRARSPYRPDEILGHQLSPNAPPSLSIVLDMLRKHVKSREERPSSIKQDTCTEVKRAIEVIKQQRLAAERKVRLLHAECHVLKRTISALTEKDRRLDDQLTEITLEVHRRDKEVRELDRQARAAAAALYQFTSKALSAVRDELPDHNDTPVSIPPDTVYPATGDGDTKHHVETLTRAREENFIRFALRASD